MYNLKDILVLILILVVLTWLLGLWGNNSTDSTNSTDSNITKEGFRVNSQNFVYNNTNEPRIILFIDILRPTNAVATFITNYILSFSSINNFVKNVNDNVEKKQ